MEIYNILFYHNVIQWQTQYSCSITYKLNLEKLISKIKVILKCSFKYNNINLFIIDNWYYRRLENFLVKLNNIFH